MMKNAQHLFSTQYSGAIDTDRPWNADVCETLKYFPSTPPLLEGTKRCGGTRRIFLCPLLSMKN